MFNDCVVLETDKWSFAVGMLSNVVWVLCASPQIYANVKTKEVDGQNPALFTLLFVGSVLSLIGIIVTDGLVTQIVTGSIYAFVDGITFLQFWWYGCVRPRCFGGREDTKTECALEMGTPAGPGAIAGLAVMAQVAAATDWKGPYQGSNLVGTLFGWVGAVVYISSRIPQVVTNFKNRKVLDLSPFFVMLSIMGNVTYTGSVLIRSIEGSFMWKQAPFLTGSVGPLTCDIIFAIQMAVFGIGTSHHQQDEVVKDQAVSSSNPDSVDEQDIGPDGLPVDMLSEL